MYLIIKLCQNIKINLHIIYPLKIFNFFTDNKTFIYTYMHLCINIYINDVKSKIRGVYLLIIFIKSKKSS
ncbi:hypothetical protein DN390_00915 [Bacillus sp. SH7-1]|nr:hypothetical protein DN390_00915 [Bacillus sp. SH7-1]